MSPVSLVLLLLGLAVLVFIALMLRQPAQQHCARSAVVSGSPDRAFDLVNHLPAWQQWSPWEGVDPRMQRTFTGPEAGVGATYGWKGNAKVGEGRMEIVASESGARVVLQLTFFKPFRGSMVATFQFEAEGEGTRVTWTSACPNSLVGRVIGVFCNMDQMMGRQFEKGLSQLDAVLRS